jgi:hypothetical protein
MWGTGVAAAEQGSLLRLRRGLTRRGFTVDELDEASRRSFGTAEHAMGKGMEGRRE